MKLQPPSCIVMGPTGTGKTDSIITLLQAGLEVFVIITEPDGIVSLIDSAMRRKVPIDKLHWAYCPPAIMGVSAIMEMATTINSMGFQQVQDIKNGIAKPETREAGMKILRLIANFHCERTGEDFGPIAKWGPNRALVMDGLSGLSDISWMLTLGVKPTAHQGEWNIMQNFIKQVLNQISADRDFFFAMTAHIERETDELSGASKAMVSTLGRKLAPVIPRYFSEVILSKKTVTPPDKVRFHWSTLDAQADTKNRTLPLSNDLEPSFAPIVEAYHRRATFLKTATTPPPSDVAATNVTTLPPTLTRK